LPEALVEVPTPWGALTASPESVALAAAVFVGWYLTLEQTEPARRRELSLSYAAAWLGAGIELVILHSVGAPEWLWPLAATLAAVVSVALVSARVALAERLDTLAPALGVACCLSLVAGPGLPLVAATAITVAAIVAPARVSGQRFLITCLALFTLA
jgi:hypothetical protein